MLLVMGGHWEASDGVFTSLGITPNREKLTAGGCKKLTLTCDDPRQGCGASWVVMDAAGSHPHPENFISWEL